MPARRGYEVRNLGADPAYAPVLADLRRRMIDAELRREASDMVRLSHA